MISTSSWWQKDPFLIYSRAECLTVWNWGGSSQNWISNNEWCWTVDRSVIEDVWITQRRGRLLTLMTHPHHRVRHTSHSTHVTLPLLPFPTVGMLVCSFFLSGLQHELIPNHCWMNKTSFHEALHSHLTPQQLMWKKYIFIRVWASHWPLAVTELRMTVWRILTGNLSNVKECLISQLAQDLVILM